MHLYLLTTKLLGLQEILCLYLFLRTLLLFLSFLSAMENERTHSPEFCSRPAFTFHLNDAVDRVVIVGLYMSRLAEGVLHNHFVYSVAAFGV